MTVVPSPLPKNHLSPSWRYPCYKLHLLHCPLPTAAAREVDSNAEETENELDNAFDNQLAAEESDEEEDSFIDTQEETQQTGSGRKTSRKKKKGRHVSATDETDQEPSRHPLSQRFHDNRNQQRIDHHPAMPPKGKKGTAASRKSARVSAADQANRVQDDREKENQQLKEQLAALKTQLELANAAGGGGTTTNATAMGREVTKTAKKKLWKRCKFIYGDKTLRKGCKFVISQLELAEFQGLEGPKLKEAQERFIAEHKNSVRLAINKQRNYVQQELRDFMMNEFKEGRAGEYPNVEEMEQLVLRNMLDDETEEAVLRRYEALFDKYWNLLAKVANHSSWNPFKRHFFLISSDGWEDEPGPNDTYVTASDEAFLLTIWKNCYNKWLYKATQIRENKDIDENDPAMETPFTDAKSGQKKYGGWKDEGIKYYEKWHKAIRKNREDFKEYLLAVEKEALGRIRKENGLEEEVPEEAPKKETGKRKASEISEKDVDEDNMEDW